MKLISFRTTKGFRVGGLRDEAVVDLAAADVSLPSSMKELLSLGAEGLERAKRAVAAGKTIDSDTVELAPVVPDPQKIICVGLNYADHARETGKPPPDEPVIFCKFPTALLPHEGTIRLPAVSSEVDYEAEMVIVIGKGGRDVQERDAREHIAGYCIGNDVSARDWQMKKPGGQWLLGKSFDTFAPLGPALVTADEVKNPNDLAVRLRLNGKTMQDSRTSQFLFKVETLVAYVSQVCTLAAGDLIFTGTPPGVGVARKPQVFLQPGDVVEVEIESLGVLRNTVAAAE